VFIYFLKTQTTEKATEEKKSQEIKNCSHTKRPETCKKKNIIAQKHTCGWMGESVKRKEGSHIITTFIQYRLYIQYLSCLNRLRVVIYSLKSSVL
jgi:hypothetical protein